MPRGTPSNFPIMEIFGPVVQGEGALIGKPTHFVRFGGCDYRCSWCLFPNVQVRMYGWGKGSKKIKDIAIGDQLIGYDERTGTLQSTTVVAKTVHASEDIWSIGIGNYTGSVRDSLRPNVTVATGDHPWMTKRGWVRTRDLQAGDVIYSAKDAQITSWLMKQSNPMKNPAVAFKVHSRGLGSRIISSSEKRIKELCDVHGLPLQLCQMQVRVGHRYPDFVIPGTNKAVEVYSPSYQNREAAGYAETLIRDYSEVGWEVLPLQVRPWFRDDALLKELNAFIMNGRTVQTVQPMPVKGKGPTRNNNLVYDITCEPYPTFFANGMLTHNCDSKFAVIPEEIQAHKTMMTVEEIVASLKKLPGTPNWVTLSGGNPALFRLTELVKALQEEGWQVAVETQGTACPEWLGNCDLVTISPKPPSSGMTTNWAKLDQFMKLPTEFVLKVVCFDEADLDYAETVRQRYLDVPFFLQVGNTVGEDDALSLLEKLRWLSESALKRPKLEDVAVLPQLHVLLYLNERAR